MTKLVKYLPRLGWTSPCCSSMKPSPMRSTTPLLTQVPSRVRILRVRGPFRGVGGATKRPLQPRAASDARATAGVRKSSVRSVLIPDRWIGWATRVAVLPLARVGSHSIVRRVAPRTAHTSPAIAWHIASASHRNRPPRRLGRQPRPSKSAPGMPRSTGWLEQELSGPGADRRRLIGRRGRVHAAPS